MTKAQAEKLIVELLELCSTVTKNGGPANIIEELADIIREIRELTLLCRQLP